MSDNNLRLQVILNAVDKLTRPFRSAQASSRELAAAVKKSRDAIKQLDQAGSSLDSFRKLQAENQKLGDRLNYARQRANLLSQELGAMGPPSQRQVVALGRQRLAVQRLEERQKKLQQQTALVRAELYRAGISAKDDAGATARLARETSRYNQELSKQEARLKRLGEAQRRMNAARASYARSLEVRDRIAGAGATTTAAGLAMGAPVMAAVKSYTSMEDAMKGVAKQVNGLRDDNGNRTARFYEMQDAIKAASEQLPMENGAVDFAALVEGGARMNVANPDDSWEDQKRDLLAFASTAAKAATAFELPADELSESLGKIAQLYKIPTRNIEQLGDALNYLDDNAMMVLGLYVFMLRTVPYQELQYQRSWRHAANSRVNRRPSTQFLGPDNDMLTLSGVLMPEITGGRLSLLALEQMAEQGKAWPLIEGSGTIYGMYVIEGLNQTKTEFFRDGMPRRIEFTLLLKRVDESLSDMFGDLSAQLNNLQDTATSALSDISKTVGGLLS